MTLPETKETVLFSADKFKGLKPIEIEAYLKLESWAKSKQITNPEVFAALGMSYGANIIYFDAEFQAIPDMPADFIDLFGLLTSKKYQEEVNFIYARILKDVEGELEIDPDSMVDDFNLALAKLLVKKLQALSLYHFAWDSPSYGIDGLVGREPEIAYYSGLTRLDFIGLVESAYNELGKLLYPDLEIETQLLEDPHSAVIPLL